LLERLAHEQDHYDYFSTETLTLSSARDAVDRGYFYLSRHYYPIFNQLELHASFDLLLHHQIAAGHELSALWSNHPRSSVVDTPVAPIPLGQQDAPDPQPAVAIPIVARDTRNQLVNAIYLHDHLSLPWDLRLVLGARGDFWSRLERRDQLDPGSGAVTQRGEEHRFSTAAFTYRVGLVYSPRRWTGTYVSYATGFRPVTEIPADGRTLAPETGWQVEIGEHLDWTNRLTGTIAAYYIEKKNVVISRGPGLFDQAGRQRSQGVEAGLEARPVRWLGFQLAYAWTDARFLHYESDGIDLAGKRPRIAALHTGSLWATLAPFTGLRFSAGGRLVGTAWADNANTVAMPAYATLDVSMEYRRGPVTVGVLSTNLLGLRRYYVSSINDTQLTPGPQREFLARLRFDL
jgi:iron complex outermembrane recepter protein